MLLHPEGEGPGGEVCGVSKGLPVAYLLRGLAARGRRDRRAVLWLDMWGRAGAQC